jgi:hypothetical protein
MADNPEPISRLSLIIGGILVAALALFIVTGGDLGGTKRVESDADLPKVTSPAPPAPDSTGSRDPAADR